MNKVVFFLSLVSFNSDDLFPECQPLLFGLVDKEVTGRRMSVKRESS